LPVARAPSRTFDSQLAIGDELTKVSVRRLSGYAEGPSDFTGLERFFAPEKIDSLTFSVIHTQIVTRKKKNRKISLQKRKGIFGPQRHQRVTSNTMCFEKAGLPERSSRPSTGVNALVRLRCATP
jgi:hypothetical protein